MRPGWVRLTTIWDPCRLAHFDDVRLEPGPVLIALVGHLFGLGQERLHLAEVEQRVSVVALLDDAGDDVALPAGYSSYLRSRSASRMRCRITCLAVWAAIRPKSLGVSSTRGPRCRLVELLP